MSESKRREEWEKLHPKDRLGDAPVEEAYHAQMVAVVKSLDELFNGDARGQDRKVGFVLMVFPFGSGPGRTNYMSNGVSRKDIVVLMREMVARFEGQPEIEGRA